MKNNLETKINELRYDSERLRGRIIEMSVNIEFLISKVLIDYFCKENKQEDMYKYIFSKNLTFQNKKDIFSSLLSNKSITNEKYYKELISDLDYFQIFRNYMSHYTLFLNEDYVLEYNGDYIIFTIFGIRNNGKNLKVRTFTDEEDIDNLTYSQEMLITRANRILTALR